MSLLLARLVAAPGTTVTPGTGDATWTGFAPTIGLPLTVTPGFGAALWAGLAPTLGLPLTVQPGVGAGQWDGYAVTISTGGGGPVIVLRFRYDP